MEKVKIQGMSCQHCVMAVTKALGSLPGVKDVKIDLGRGEATFQNPRNVSREEMRRAVEDAGFQVPE